MIVASDMASLASSSSLKQNRPHLLKGLAEVGLRMLVADLKGIRIVEVAEFLFGKASKALRKREEDLQFGRVFVGDALCSLSRFHELSSHDQDHEMRAGKADVGMDEEEDDERNEESDEEAREGESEDESEEDG